MRTGFVCGLLLLGTLVQAQNPESDLPPVNGAAAELSPEEQVNVAVYQKANRSVVNITTRSVQADDFFMLMVPRQGSGSGIVLSKKGHVLTNYHVIDEARQIAVTLFDGTAHPAKLIGSDPNNDLAILQIQAPAEKLIPIGWADSNQVVVGMRTFTIGNPFGLERTMTTGIVSSLNRTLNSENNRLIRGIIQTDAAINPGNSGGPLLNRRGEMIGITTAIIGRSGQSSGIGLAVPANTARRVVEEVLKHGRVIRPDVGIASVLQRDDGLLIARLVPDGPAEKAGLQGPAERVVQRNGFLFRTVDRSAADLITAVDGKEVRTIDAFLTQVETKRPGEEVVLTIIRGGKQQQVTVKLDESKN